MRMAAVGMMFFRSARGKIFLATIDTVSPVSSTPRVFTSPKTDAYPEHHIRRSPRASLSELHGAGHFKLLLLRFRRHAHETGAFAGVRLVPIFVGTLSPLFLLGLCLGTGSRSRVWLPTGGLRVPAWRSIGVPSGLVRVLVLVRRLRSVPPRPPLPLPPWPLSLPLDLALPLSLSALPLPLPLPLAFSVLSFAERRCLW